MLKKILKWFLLASFVAVPLSSCTNKNKKEMVSNPPPNMDPGNTSGTNENNNPREPLPPINRSEGMKSEDKSGKMEADRSSDSSNETKSLQLSLKSKAVIASDLVTQASGGYSLNWSKFMTNLNSEEQTNSRLLNLIVDDREGQISFDLQVGGNQKLSFKEKVDFDFQFLKALTFNWTDTKPTTTNSSLTQLQKVTNAQGLSEFATPVLSVASDDSTNYFTYLSDWFDVNLTYVSVDKKLEQNDLTFDYQLTINPNKRSFYQIENNSKQPQLWHSDKDRTVLSYPSDLSKAAADVIINKTSELFDKPIDYFYDTTNHTVKTDQLEVTARNNGLIKFSNSKYNDQFAITLVQNSASFNTDRNELTFTVEIKPKDSNEFNSMGGIGRTFTITTYRWTISTLPMN
ncbi:hypothetical protein [Mycoplasmoides gallisepticum]|uniref:hypothetical protein n=1 Tax=Mycoplasmoides gallisepticum TaxID=2096 RepID=UPI0033058655